ncbi:MAG: hypothetical protein ABGY10_00080, partial [bacterium]
MAPLPGGEGVWVPSGVPHYYSPRPPLDYKTQFCSDGFLVSDCLGVPALKKILQKFQLTTEEVKMRNLRSVIFGLSFLVGGVFLANLFGAEAG